jgi:hypothetical protein
MYKILVFCFLSIFLLNNIYTQEYIKTEPFANEDISKIYNENDNSFAGRWWKRDKNGNIIKKVHIVGNILIVTNSFNEIIFRYNIEDDIKKFPMKFVDGNRIGITYAETLMPLYDTDDDMNIIWFYAGALYWIAFLGKIDFETKLLYLYVMQDEITIENPIVEIEIDIENDIVFYSDFFEPEKDANKEYHLYRYDLKQKQIEIIETNIGSGFGLGNYK